MNASILDRIPFGYSIEIWRGMVPVADIIHTTSFRVYLGKHPCILKIGNTAIAIGHFEQGNFIIDEMLTRQE